MAKEVFTFEEVVVGEAVVLVIPGAVDLVPFAVKLYNVPGVGDFLIVDVDVAWNVEALHYFLEEEGVA